MERVGRLFSSEGVLLDGSSVGLSALLAAIERINCRNPDVVRISSEVVAHAALEKARRGLRMGEVLMAGGFAEEAEEACRGAVALAANAPRFLRASANENTPEEVPDHVEAMTADELALVQGELDLYPDAALTLQMSVQGLPLPDCVTRASRFLEECALMM